MTSLLQKKMSIFRNAGLYLVTSQSMSAGRTTLEILEPALKAGVKLIQLREKELSANDLYRLAVKARDLTSRHNALLLINDRLDIAMASGADGVHLGQSDLPIQDARRIAPDMIIGSSSHNEAEAVKAQEDGASYVNIGPIFPTGTKKWDDEFLGVESIPRISKQLKIPFTVMGGIKLQHIPELRKAGARIIAVVSAITAALDPVSSASALLKAIKE